MRYIVLSILVSIFLIACYSDSSDFTPYEDDISTVIGKELISNNPSPTIKSFIDTIKYDSLKGITKTWRTKRGTQVILDNIYLFETNCYSIESNCLADCSNGNPVKNGEELMIEIIEIWKKGDMIRYARPTISEGKPLDSGTELLITLRKKKTGEILQMRPWQRATIRIRKIDEAKLVESMFTYYGSFNETDSTFNWQRDTASIDKIGLSTWVDSVNVTGWQLGVNRFGWINCDAPILNDATKQYTNLTLQLPSTFTHQNTVAWVLLNNYNSALYTRTGFLLNQFYIDKIPINESVTIVTISKDKDKIFLGSEKRTIGSTPQTFNLTPTEKTLKEINDFLDSL